MKNTSIILAALTMICCSPASKEHQTKGIVCDATMNTISIVTANKDTLSFSTLDADKSHVTGLLLNDTAEIFYKGKYTAGMSATKLIVYKNQALGALQTRTYEGTLPAASCSGIRYSLTIQNQEHSGNGTFTLTMTYIEAENGKDAIFNYKGKDSHNAEMLPIMMLLYGNWLRITEKTFSTSCVKTKRPLLY